MNRYLLVAVLAGLLIYVFRRRLALALKIAAASYALLVVFRLVLAGDADLPVLEAVAGLALFVVVWAVLWAIVKRRERGRLR